LRKNLVTPSLQETDTKYVVRIVEGSLRDVSAIVQFSPRVIEVFFDHWINNDA